MTNFSDAARATAEIRATRRIEDAIERKLKVAELQVARAILRRSHHRMKLSELPDRIKNATHDQEVDCRIKGMIRHSRGACFMRQTCRVVMPGANQISFWCKGIKNDPDNELNLPKFLYCNSDPIRGVPACPEYLTKDEVRLLVKHLNQGFRFKSMQRNERKRS